MNITACISFVCPLCRKCTSTSCRFLFSGDLTIGKFLVVLDDLRLDVVKGEVDVLPVLPDFYLLRFIANQVFFIAVCQKVILLPNLNFHYFWCRKLKSRVKLIDTYLISSVMPFFWQTAFYGGLYTLRTPNGLFSVWSQDCGPAFISLLFSLQTSVANVMPGLRWKNFANSCILSAQVPNHLYRALRGREPPRMGHHSSICPICGIY